MCAAMKPTKTKFNNDYKLLLLPMSSYNANANIQLVFSLNRYILFAIYKAEECLYSLISGTIGQI